MTEKPAARRRGSQPPAQPPEPTPDPWQIWFSRIIQIVGLAIVIYETVGAQVDRPWLLLVAVAMMVGGLGLQFLVRWLLERMP